MTGSITDVPGILVGHWTDLAAGTGTTVVLCDPAAIAGVDVRGAAPGTRETDLLRPTTLIDRADAVLLSGGSAFGLAAADGVVRWLRDHDRGHVTAFAKVPIVPGAILYDLGMTGRVQPPGPDAGYAAAAAAGRDVPQGSVGAGTGATCAKAGGLDFGVKAGIGTASETLPDGTVVGALVAVNPVGDVYDEDDRVLAASRRGGTATDLLAAGLRPVTPRGDDPGASNTTIGVIATSASLDKDQAIKLAMMAHDGVALAIRPAHTMADGDVLFALATGDGSRVDAWTLTTLGAVAVRVVRAAIANAVREATSVGAFPAIRDLA